MKRATIFELIEGLRSIPDSEFVCRPVYDFLGANPIDVSTITPYLFWSDKFYTRNLIFKDDRFEMMAICWEPGQVSAVHDHADQRCWMTAPLGTLRGQNFAIEELDESNGICKLVETDTFDLSDCQAARVELEQPIHQILNLAEFKSRAVSLHIYSKPFDKCMSYFRDTNTFKEVPLFYTSVAGKLCDNVQL